MTARGRTWAKSEEYLCELSVCKNCRKEVHFIINSKSNFARCPECTYFAPKDQLNLKIVGISYHNTDESDEDARIDYTK